MAKLVKLSVILALVGMLGGCYKAWYFAHLEDAGSIYKTPDNTYNLINPSKRAFDKKKKPVLRLIVDHEYSPDVVKVYIAFHREKLSVGVSTINGTSLEWKEEYYQFDDEPKAPLKIISDAKYRNSPKSSTKSYGRYYELPDHIDLNIVTENRITKNSYKSLKRQDDDVHRVYLPFIVDGQEYVLDARFKIKVEKERYLEWFAAGIP